MAVRKLKNFTPISVRDFLKEVNIDCINIIGNLDNIISGEKWVRSLQKAEQGTVTFCYRNPDIKGQDIIQDITKSNATLIITHDDVSIIPKSHQVIIGVENPLGTFVDLLNQITYVDIRYLRYPEISVYVGPNVYIEDGARIGKNVTLVGNIYIYGNTIIGDNVHIGANTVIGGESVGYITLKDKRLLFSHIGGVQISDDVYIGSNVCIDRGTLENTIIGKGCIINNHVQISHQVDIGDYSRVADRSVICGGVVVGKNVYISPSTTINSKVKIDDNVFIGLASTVIKDVPVNARILSIPTRINLG
jgi:serine acetyltransferase